MANSREIWFTGFEGGERLDIAGVTNRVVADGTARTGSFYFNSRRDANAGSLISRAYTQAEISLASEVIVVRTQVAIRSFGNHSNTSTSGLDLLGNSQGTSGTPTGRLAIKDNGDIIAIASGSSTPSDPINLPTDGVWRILRYEFRFSFPDVGSSASRVQATVTLLTEDLVEIASETVVNDPVTISTTRRFINGNIFLFTSTTTNTAGFHLDVDDWWIGVGAGTVTHAEIPWPNGTRAVPVPATGVGSHTWTGDWRVGKSVPHLATTNELTTPANGAKATFTHATASQLALGSIQGVKAYASCRRTSGSGTDKVVIGGTSYDMGDTSSGTIRSAATTSGKGQAATVYDPDTPMDQATFDGLEFGAEATDTTTTLGSVMMEAWCTGPGVPPQPGPGHFQQAVGAYTPSAAYQQVDVGFKPDLVIVKKINSGSSTGSRAGTTMKAWWMGGSISYFNDTVESHAIVELNATGFLLGPAVSANDTLNAGGYAFLAIRDGRQDPRFGAVMQTGGAFRTAVGATQAYPVPIPSGQDTWIPDVVILHGLANMVLRTPNMPAGESLIFGTSTAMSTVGVTGVASGSISRGTTSASAVANQVNPWIAWRFDALDLLGQFLATAQYVGTGSPLTIPVAAPFAGTPEMIWLDHWGSAYPGVMRSRAGHSSDLSTPWSGINATSIGITGESDNQFTTGSSATAGLNISVNGGQGYWLAFGNGEIPAPSNPRPRPRNVLAGTAVGLIWYEAYLPD
jgi:hypothetical protein